MGALTINGWAIPLMSGEFALSAPLTEGDNTFTLVATDTQGRSAQATATVTLDSSPPTITRGFKTLQAERYWHGALPFMTSPGCATGTPDVKYLHPRE